MTVPPTTPGLLFDLMERAQELTRDIMTARQHLPEAADDKTKRLFTYAATTASKTVDYMRQAYTREKTRASEA